MGLRARPAAGPRRGPWRRRGSAGPGSWRAAGATWEFSCFICLSHSLTFVCLIFKLYVVLIVLLQGRPGERDRLPRDSSLRHS